MTEPSLTVAVCTLDRADLLAACLDAIDAQDLVGVAVEVLVVDNGSVDHTAAVVAAHPRTRRVVEPRRGLSHAWNTALRGASADLVAFLDDDARPAPGWAAAMVRALERFPHAVAIGGPVALEWGAKRPSWLIPQLERWYSGRDLGTDLRVLDADEQPVGANLAVRRGPAMSAGGFAVDLGRVGRTLGSEEEVVLLRRLRAGGGDVIWAPDAAVRHVVDAERMTRRWLVRRAWAQGRSDVVAARLEGRELTARPGRAALAAIAAGWPRATREVADAEIRSGATMRELVRRARRLGQIRAHLEWRRRPLRQPLP